MQQEQRQNGAGPSQSSRQQGKQIAILTQKLNAQSERILKWKMQTEMELKKRDEKIKESESIIQRQHTNMLNQQLHCEKLSQRLQTELLNRGELKGRVDNTRQICSILQNHCTCLTDSIQRCINEKEILKNAYNEQLRDINDLTQKFANLNDEYALNVERLNTMVAEERQGRIKNFNDAKALKATMEQRLEALSKVLKNEKEKTEMLAAQLSKSEAAIELLSKEKKSYREQLELAKSHLIEVEATLTTEKEQLKRELELMHQSLDEEKQRVEALRNQEEQMLANLRNVVQTKDEALEENASKQDMINKMSDELTIKDKQIQENIALLEDLRGEKCVLESQVQELEQLRQEFSHLQINLELTTQQKEMETEQLTSALEELQQLHKTIQQNEQVIEKCEQERQSSDQQMLKLEKANEDLDNKLVQAQTLISSMSANIEQLKEDLEIKCGEIEALRSNLNSLTLSSESELKEKLKEAEEMETSNGQLKSEIKELKQNIKELENKSGGLEEKVVKLQNALDEEGQRSSESASALMECSSALVKLQEQLKKQEDELTTKSATLMQANEDKQQLEYRMETLLKEMVKLSSDKNNALSDAACAHREQDLLRNESEAKLQNAITVIEKCKQEYDQLLQQQTSLEQELKETKENKQATEEKLHHVEKQLNDTLHKMKMLAEKHEGKKQRLVEKVNQLEKRLKVKNSELKDMQECKSNACASPKSPLSTFSNKSHQHKSPPTAVPSTPKLKSAEATRSILKTPTTPLTRKRVMFQDDSSDTDVSTVDILVIDEKEVQRRVEALKHGKVSSAPLPAVKSPRISGSQSNFKNRDGDMIKAPREAPVAKRIRYSANKENQAKKTFQDDFENAFGFNED